MKLRNLNVLILAFFSIFQGFSQNQNTQPSVMVSDHKGNTSTIVVDCNYDFLSEKKIKLKATYPNISNSDEYTVSEIPYLPIGSFSQGNAIPEIKDKIGKKDDVFGQQLLLPFEFCFYDTTFNSFTLSDNGVLSFGDVNIQEPCPYIVAADAPSEKLPKNSIFGLYHDLKNESLMGKIKTYTMGDAPYRKFIINYDQVSLYGSTSLTSTFQMVLYETSNIIDIYIANKSVNTAISPAIRNASLIGLNNKDGKKGIIAPNRGKGIWTTKNQAYRFTPAGGQSPKIKWYDENQNVIGQENEIIVNPSNSTTYKAEVTYFLCKEEKVSQTIDIQFVNNFPTANSLEKRLCSTQENLTIDLSEYKTEINPDAELTFTFHHSETDAHTGANPLSENYLMTMPEKTIFVRVLRNGNCYIVSQIILKKTGVPKVKDNQTITYCNNYSGSIYVNFSELMLEGTSGYNTTFYNSLSDAENKQNEIRDIYVTNTHSIYARVSNPDDALCYTIVSVTLSVDKQLSPKRHEVYVCNTILGQRIRYDLTQHLPDLLTDTFDPNAVTISFYQFSDYSGKIEHPENTWVTLNKRYYVELSYAGNCPVRTYLDILYDDDCDTGGGSSIINLPIPTMCGVSFPIKANIVEHFFYPYMLNNTKLQRSDIVLHGIFFDLDATQPVSDATNYTFTDNTSIVLYASYTYDGIRTVVPFPIMVSKKIPLTDTNFTICDARPLGSEEIWLDETSQYYTRLKNLYGNFTEEIFFFETQADRTNFYNDFRNGNENLALTKQKVTVSNTNNKFYASILAYGCLYDYDLTITLQPLTEIEIPLEVCDFGPLYAQETVDLSLFEDDLHNLFLGKTIESIKYYPTSDDAHQESINEITAYWATPIQDPDNSIFARVSIENQCATIVEMKFSYKTSVRLPDYQKTITLCDKDNDSSETFTLSSIISQTSVDTGTLIEFYNTFEGAQNKTSANLIGVYSNTPLTMTLTQSIDVYMRIEDSTTGCYRIFTIPVRLIPYPVLENTMVYLCDYLNDGKENFSADFISSSLLGSNPSVVNSTMNFEYFTSESDALSGINSVTQYSQAVNNQEIWVKITPEDSQCSQVNKVTLKLTQSPEDKEVTITICNNNTRNTDGNVMEIVNLDDYRTLYLSEGADLSRYYFYYFTSESDALSLNNFLFEQVVVDAFPKTFFARVQDGYTGCFSIVKIIFKPHKELPVQNIAPEMCGENGGYATRNLKDFTEDMLVGTATITDFSTHFYPTLNEAIISQNELTNTEVTFTNNDVYWVKFTHLTTGCFIFRKITFKVHPSAKMDAITKEICDENLDYVYKVNLDAYKTDIITGEDLATINATYNFSFHKTEDEVFSNSNPLNTNYSFSSTDLIPDATNTGLYRTWVYARAITNDVNKCLSYSKIEIQVKIIPLLSQNITLSTCDDITKDGKETFDLTSKTNEITSKTDVTFRYFLTQHDMINQVNEIANPDRFINTQGYAQSIYVRLSADNFCDNWAIIHLKVSPYIDVKDADPIAPFCDYTHLNKQYALDLTAQLTSMKENVNDDLFNQLNITYYTSALDAQNKTNPIISPTNYISPIGENTIFVRFENSESLCYQIRTISFKRWANPKLNHLEKNICDADFDSEFVEVLENYISEIIPDTDTHTVAFFKNLEDAKRLTNAVTSPYRFSFSDLIEQNEQQIMPLIVRVTDQKGCVSYTPLTFIVPKKIDLLTNSTSITLCDDANDDGVQTFDLTSQESKLTTASGATFRYFLTQTDMKNNVNEIVNPTHFTNTMAYNQTIYIRISQTNRCDNNAQILLRVNPYIKLTNTVLPYICKYTSDGENTFLNLKDALPNVLSETKTEIKNDLKLSFHTSQTDAENAQNPIHEPEKVSVQVGKHTFWVRGEHTKSNCYNIVKIDAERLEYPLAKNHTAEICFNYTLNAYTTDLNQFKAILAENTDNHFKVDFYHNEEDARKDRNKISNSNSFSLTSNEQVLYTRVTNAENCVDFSQITLKALPKLYFSLEEKETCEDGVQKQWVELTFTDISLDVSELSYTINHNNSALAKKFTKIKGNVAHIDKSEFNDLQEQFITIFHKDCQYQNNKTFKINILHPLHIIDLSDNDPYSRIVNFQGTGGKPPYIFTINSNHTESPTYYINPSKTEKIINDEGKTIAITYVVVTDQLGCTAELAIHKEIIDVYAPNFFTPNNDGENDTWTIYNTQSYPNLLIHIFDRQGRLLKKLKQKDTWDGNYQGIPLPSGDYWYEVRLNGINDNRTFVGHFTLIR